MADFTLKIVANQKLVGSRANNSGFADFDTQPPNVQASIKLHILILERPNCAIANSECF